MKRRNFLKGFLAATGTLAVAPALALEPIEHYGPSELWPIMEEIIDHQMKYNRLMIEMDRFIAMRSARINLLAPVVQGISIESDKDYFFIGEEAARQAGTP